VVEETGALCMVAFQRRFDPTFRRLKQAVEKGEIGDVHMIHITSRDPGPPPVAYIAQVRRLTHAAACIFSLSLSFSVLVY